MISSSIFLTYPLRKLPLHIDMKTAFLPHLSIFTTAKIFRGEGVFQNEERNFLKRESSFFILIHGVHFSEFVLSTQFYSLPRRAGLGCSASIVMTEKNYYAERNGLFPRKGF